MLAIGLNEAHDGSYWADSSRPLKMLASLQVKELRKALTALPYVGDRLERRPTQSFIRDITGMDESDQSAAFADMIYCLFGPDSEDGTIDWYEFVSGLSVLCR